MADMPSSQAEWEAHQAFHRHTVAQRDSAWREIEMLNAAPRLTEAEQRALVTLLQWYDTDPDDESACSHASMLLEGAAAALSIERRRSRG